MSNKLELVYQYRQYLAKCESGEGLEMEEIHTVSMLESLFEQDASQSVQLDASLRHGESRGMVKIVNLGPAGMACRNAPNVSVGGTVEVAIEDEELGLSYRFKGVVVWRRDDVNGWHALGLEFVGAPLLVRRGRSGDSEENQASAA